MHFDFFILTEIIGALFFAILLFLSFILALRSKKEYRFPLILITLIAFFCILFQAVLFFGPTYFPNMRDVAGGFVVIVLSLISLALTKKIVKLT
jgi:uncharacterized membrane protein YccC